MLLGRKRIIAPGAEAMMLDVVLFVLAVGDLVERQIWDLRQRIVERLGGGFLLRLYRRHRLLQRADFTQEALGLFLVLVFLGFADFLRRRVAARLCGFEFKNLRTT